MPKTPKRPRWVGEDPRGDDYVTEDRCRLIVREEVERVLDAKIASLEKGLTDRIDTKMEAAIAKIQAQTHKREIWALALGVIGLWGGNWLIMEGRLKVAVQEEVNKSVGGIKDDIGKIQAELRNRTQVEVRDQVINAASMPIPADPSLAKQYIDNLETIAIQFKEVGGQFSEAEVEKMQPASLPIIATGISRLTPIGGGWTAIDPPLGKLEAFDKKRTELFGKTQFKGRAVQGVKQDAGIQPLDGDTFLSFGPFSELLSDGGGEYPLDGFFYRGFTFKNVKIAYRGGALKLERTRFINCSFEINTSVESGRRFARSLVLKLPQSISF